MSFDHPASPHALRAGGLSQPPQPVLTAPESAVDSMGVVYNPRKEYIENGRFYHAWHKGKYMFPCDEEEKNRLDIFHKVFLLARHGQLFKSPLAAAAGRTTNILDLGCGTGIWSIDVADHYDPDKVFVRGVDLAMMQPEEIPRNVEFLQVDVETPWQSMGRDTWDLIHVRTFAGSIQDWGRLYSQIFSHLRPRLGHLEQVEIDFTPRCEDGSLSPAADMVSWARELFAAMEDHGRSLRVDSQTTMSHLRDAGFVDIQEEIIDVPINGWPDNPEERELGRYLCLGLTFGLIAMSMAPLVRMRGKSRAEVEAMADRVKNEMADRRIHAYCRVYVWTARRP